MSEYIASCNAGQLGAIMLPRIDTETYRAGCLTLNNFHVLPQGGIDRRVGSQFLLEALSDDSRIIPFNFTRDISYQIELNPDGIRIINGDGSIAYELDSPYDADDIQNIKYEQRNDILWMVCGTKPVYEIRRTDLNPLTFEIEESIYDYPPFMADNVDYINTVEFKPELWVSGADYNTLSQVTDGDDYWACTSAVSGSMLPPSGDATHWEEITKSDVDTTTFRTLIMTGTSEIFHEDQVGGYFRVSQDRGNEEILGEGDGKSIRVAHPIPEFNAIVGTYDRALKVGDEIVRVNTTMGKVKHRGDWYTRNVQVIVHGADFTPYDIDVYVTPNYEIVKSHSGPGSFIDTIDMSLYPDFDYITLYYPFYGHGLDSEIEGQLRVESIWSITKGIDNVVYLETDVDNFSDALDVSFSNWKITTTGDWRGSIQLQKSTDNGGSWRTLTTLLDTSRLENNNDVWISSEKESANTLIRVSYKSTFGTLVAVIENTTLRGDGIVRITDYIDSKNVEVEVVSNLVSANRTAYYAEGAWSNYRGYPSSIEMHENRLCYSGVENDPSTVYMSAIDDYYNFNYGVDTSDAIEITPTTSEPTTWLLSKGGVLYQGTRGSVVSIKSASNSILTPTSILAVESLQFGGGLIQAIKSNEAIIYLDRQNTKLREAIFNDSEQSLKSRELTINVPNIAGDLGFKELILQQIPDQIIYGIRSDGQLGVLTYERSQDVFGWSVFDFGGNVTSISSRSVDATDELWLIIKRDGGSYIEKVGSRLFSDDLLDSWYVDSGVKTVLPSRSDTVPMVKIVDGTSKIQITNTDHGLTDGDFVRLDETDDGWIDIKHDVFMVADATTDTFVLKDVAGDVYINPDYYDTNGTEVLYLPVSNVWTGFDHLEGEDIQIVGDGSYSDTYTVSGGSVTTDNYYNQVVGGLRYLSVFQPMPPETEGYYAKRYKQSVMDVSTEFLRTIGGYIGIRKQTSDRYPIIDIDDLKDNLPNLDRSKYTYEALRFRTYEDPIGEIIEPFTGSKLSNFNDTYSNMKAIFIVQDIPQPMTIGSMAIHTGILGKGDRG